MLGKMRALLGRIGSPDLLPVVALLVASRLLLTGIGVYSQQLLKKPVDQVSSIPPALAIWNQWDGGWYLSIARNGYGEPWTPGHIPEGETRYGFFPLYPLLIAALGLPLAGDHCLAGFLISNAAFLASCWLLYRYARLSDDPETSRWAVIAMIAFPASFILSAILTEPLYLALLLASFYLARTGRWWSAGLAGCALAATRPEGWLMAVPLAVEYWSQCRKGRSPGLQMSAIALVPAGTALFFCYLYVQTGDWWTYPRAKVPWNILGMENPLSVLFAPWRHVSLPRDPMFLFGSLLSLASLAAVVVAWKRIALSERVLVLLAFYPLMAGGLTVGRGMPRHLVTAFPLYLILARSTDAATRPVMIACLFLVQGFAMVFWANGFPMIV